MLSCLTSCYSFSHSRTTSIKLKGRPTNIVLCSFSGKSNFSSTKYYILYKVTDDDNYPIFTDDQQRELEFGKHPWNERKFVSNGFWTINVRNKRMDSLMLSDKDKYEVVRYFSEREVEHPSDPFRMYLPLISDSLYDSLPTVSLEKSRN